MHFSEIINLQHEKKKKKKKKKKTPYIALNECKYMNISIHCFVVFELLLLNYLLKKCVVTPNFLFGFQQPLLKSA